MLSLPILLPLVVALQGAPSRPAVVVDYDLTLTLPDAGRTIDGTAVLTVRRLARGGAADTLALDLLDLTVKRVRVGDRDAAFTHSGGLLRIPIAGAADSFRVTVAYGGVPKDALIIATDSAGRWTAFGDNWPNRARHWIPSIDHPSQKATVTWTVIAPADRKVVANGTLVSEALVPQPEDPDGHAGAPIAMRKTVWRESHPIPAYLMVIGVGPLVMTSLGNTACGFADGGGCVPQAVFTMPERVGIARVGFSEADSIVTFFSRRFGPFPYEKLWHVQSASRFGGMENASAIFYADQVFRTGGAPYALVAHETAHQWFGDAVTEREWPHLWLSEGFATYLSALYTEHSRGAAAFRAEMDSVRRIVLGAPVVASRPVIDTIETTLMNLLNRNSYEKGGFVLHMLRREVGDSAFFAGARAYQATYRHATALTDDFRHAVERASGRDLKAFFDQWLTRPGFPELTTAWRWDAAAGRTVLTVTQSGRFGLFAFPLTVELLGDDGVARRVTVRVPAQREATLPLDAAPRLGRAPARVRIDPDADLLARITAP